MDQVYRPIVRLTAVYVYCYTCSITSVVDALSAYAIAIAGSPTLFTIVVWHWSTNPTPLPLPPSSSVSSASLTPNPSVSIDGIYLPGLAQAGYLNLIREVQFVGTTMHILYTHMYTCSIVQCTQLYKSCHAKALLLWMGPRIWQQVLGTGLYRLAASLVTSSGYQNQIRDKWIR